MDTDRLIRRPEPQGYCASLLQVRMRRSHFTAYASPATTVRLPKRSGALSEGSKRARTA